MLLYPSLKITTKHYDGTFQPDQRPYSRTQPAHSVDLFPENNLRWSPWQSGEMDIKRCKFTEEQITGILRSRKSAHLAVNVFRRHSIRDAKLLQ